MWFGIRKYYEKLSRDEIESVKETFSKLKKINETITNGTKFNLYLESLL